MEDLNNGPTFSYICRDIPVKVWSCTPEQLSESVDTFLTDCKSVINLISESLDALESKYGEKVPPKYFEERDFLRNYMVFWGVTVPKGFRKLVLQLNKLIGKDLQNNAQILLDLNGQGSEYNKYDICEIQFSKFMRVILGDFAKSINCEVVEDVLSAQFAIDPILETRIDHIMERMCP